MSNQPSERTIYSVSQLNRLARNLMENEFAQIWVEGEISNFVRPASGHWYFSLKDEQAQVRCAMFTNRNRNIRFQPKDGMQVILRGKASIYEGRGDYQLIAENLMQAGEGLLQQRFEELKQKLEREGLFAPEYKQPIPAFPRHIGVITSPTGAAIRDILTVLARRFPAIPITLIPTQVQGSTAAMQIVKAIELANRTIPGVVPLDVVILGRGGGSLEDLWCFNEEQVARAVFSSKVPIVSAVGHEIDFTIADFVADLRAPTPSAAAELITPDQIEYRNNLVGYGQYLTELLRKRVARDKDRIDSLRKRLRHPGRHLQDYAQRLDHIEARLTNAANNGVRLRRATVARCHAELHQHQPIQQLRALQRETRQLEQRLKSSIKYLVQHYQQQLRARAQELNTLSPLETLQRGYAIVLDQEQQIIRKATQARIGDKVTAKLKEGTLRCSVEEIESC